MQASSKPIPIKSTRGLTSSSIAQSAPMPRAPVIGSLPASSLLASSTMPVLELPPPSPQSLPISYAQSAPLENCFLSSQKPILHTFHLRGRSDSVANSRRVSWNESDVLFEDDNENVLEEEEITEPSSMDVFSTIRSLTGNYQSTHMNDLSVHENVPMPPESPLIFQADETASDAFDEQFAMDGSE